MTKKTRREDGSDCIACFAKDCDCECNTCNAYRIRNNTLSSKELDGLNIKDAIEKGKEHK